MSKTTIKIPAELFALAESSRFEGEIEIGVLQAGPDDYAFSEPLHWEVNVTNTGSALLVAGTVTGTATCACARCLDDVVYDLTGDIEGYFIIEGAQVEDEDEGEDEPGIDEFDVLPDDHIINMEPLIKAALLMDVPDQPLCRDDCAGLCPTCGANLNEGDCGCGRDAALEDFDRAANPFAALADFKFDE